MTYEIENEVEIDFDFDYKELFKRIVDTVLDEEQCPYEASVNLLITSDECVREINKECRNIDSATDVLSFPMVQYDTPADFDILEELDDCFEPDTGELLLGDIVLSLEPSYSF